jgi:signal transduction histidine kinase
MMIAVAMRVRAWRPGLFSLIAVVLGGIAFAVPTWHWPASTRPALLAMLVAAWVPADRGWDTPALVATPLVTPAVLALAIALLAGGETFAAIFLVLLTVCAAMSGSSRWTAAVALASVLGVTAPVLLLRSDGTLTPIYWDVGICLAAVFGRLMFFQRRLTGDLRAAQAALLEHALDLERRRIAREVHDLVAHLLTVTMLQVTAARLALPVEPDEASAALADAERLGRQSLIELRRTIGLLRSEDEGRLPLPVATDIAGLVERFRVAGMPARLEVDGDPATLGPSAGLTLYRVVQESLSNAATHSSGAAVRVTVALGPSRTTAIVYCEPAGTAGLRAGSGVGIRGMRERAELLGGTLTAGPEGPGWRVECNIPAAGAGASGTPV